MTEQWARIVADGTADTASNDTTEATIGSGIAVPTWAKSIIQAVFSLGTITMTTAEDVAGYFRIDNNANTIDPLNWPMPVIPANLAGAAAGQMHFPVSVPVFQNVTPNDTINIKAAFDGATTGVHLFGGYLLFSSRPAPFRLHAQKMAATAIGDGLSESSQVNIETLADKTSQLLGIWGYQNIGGTVVAADGSEPYMRVKASLPNWVEQRLPLNVENACLGADSYIVTKPVVYLYQNSGLWDFFNGFHTRMLGFENFPVNGRQSFTFSAQHTRDVNDSADAVFRGGLIWRE